jgi:hypothetical protein
MMRAENPLFWPAVALLITAVFMVFVVASVG